VVERNASRLARQFRHHFAGGSIGWSDGA